MSKLPTAYLITAISDDGAIPMITARPLNDQSGEHQFFVPPNMLADILPIPHTDILLVWSDGFLMWMCRERYDDMCRRLTGADIL